MTHGPELTPRQEAAAEDAHRHTWPDEDDRLTMDLEPFPDSQVY
jgi:predicted small lipoprotein YifL